MAAAGPRMTTMTDKKYGLTFAVPSGWRAEVSSTYQVVARGKEGGFETHIVIQSTPERAVHDYFLPTGELGDVHKDAQWVCASSRSWRLNPRVGVAICSRRLRNGHALVATLTAEREWLVRAGGESFLRTLVAPMRGFRAEDD